MSLPASAVCFSQGGEPFSTERMPKESIAWQRGRKDYALGRENPYSHGTMERAEWIAGWCAERYGN